VLQWFLGNTPRGGGGASELRRSKGAEGKGGKALCPILSVAFGSLFGRMEGDVDVDGNSPGWILDVLFYHQGMRM